MRAGVRVSVISCYSMHMRRNRAVFGRWIAAAVWSAAFFVVAAAQSSGVHPVSGRRIAPVMGYQGADWLERPERIEEEEPETALDVLKIQKGRGRRRRRGDRIHHGT